MRLGRQIHNKMQSKGLLEKDIVLSSALIDMYAQCGVIEKAQAVHGELPLRDVMSWTELIVGYVQHGKGHAVLNCLENMQIEGLLPSSTSSRHVSSLDLLTRVNKFSMKFSVSAFC